MRAKINAVAVELISKEDSLQRLQQQHKHGDTAWQQVGAKVAEL